MDASWPPEPSWQQPGDTKTAVTYCLQSVTSFTAWRRPTGQNVAVHLYAVLSNFPPSSSLYSRPKTSAHKTSIYMKGYHILTFAKYMPFIWSTIAYMFMFMQYKMKCCNSREACSSQIRRWLTPVVTTSQGLLTVRLLWYIPSMVRGNYIGPILKWRYIYTQH